MVREKIKHIKKILVGVDDSADSQLAFRVAMKRAVELNAKLYIVSILEPSDMSVYQVLDADYVHGQRDELEKHLQKYQRVAEKFGVKKVELIIDEGKPGEVIIENVIPAIQPDLLIVGALAKRGMRKYFGSQAAYMAKYAPISVLVVR